MIIKEMLYNDIRKYKMNKYIKTKCKYEVNINTIDCARILYVVVAFNDVSLIKYQFRLLRRFVKEKYSYLVADNSNDKTSANMIRMYCMENQIAYIKLPDNSLKLSDSHAATLNWVSRNVLSSLKEVEWIGFIDHDCFPIREISVYETGQIFYGLRQERGEKWYLWPGFCFFKTKCIDISKLDFSCTNWGDTGSAMYETIYNNETGDLCFAELKYEQILLNEKAKYVQEGQIEILDGKWCHVSNGSNWLSVETANKMDIVYQMLDKILK